MEFTHKISSSYPYTHIILYVIVKNCVTGDELIFHEERFMHEKFDSAFFFGKIRQVRMVMTGGM